jgi:acetylornithine/N-succinyldiaminopimelate aminotransferase
MSTTDFPVNLAQTTSHPFGIQISHAKGSYVIDTDGKNYLDFISGIAVSNIGHGHPKVIEAIKNQADKHLHVMVYGEYEQNSQTEFAKLLCQQLPPSLNQVYFVNSGAEATEGALKLAKRITGRTQLISFEKSYHGSTHGALSVTGNENKKYAFRPLLPNVEFLRFNNISDLENITNKCAAVIVEPIQGDAGVRIPTMEFMQALRQKCTETVTQLIFDEIQTGFGRTGKMFAFEHFKVTPDILTLGKALGGGLPMGAFVSSRAKMELLTHNPELGHITTFGGHPLVCAAGKAALDVLLDEKLIEGVEKKGKTIEQSLSSIHIKEIRRKGLFFAIEMFNHDHVQQVVHYCKDAGLIGFWFLSANTSFRIAPPLNISDSDILKATRIMQAAFNSIH